MLLLLLFFLFFSVKTYIFDLSYSLRFVCQNAASKFWAVNFGSFSQRLICCCFGGGVIFGFLFLSKEAGILALKKHKFSFQVSCDHSVSCDTHPSLLPPTERNRTRLLGRCTRLGVAFLLVLVFSM